MNIARPLIVGLAFGPIAALAGPVDINAADAETLARELRGIGPARAEAIVTFREEHGPFESAEDLLKVQGVGQRVLDDNRDDLQVSGGKQGGAKKSD